MFRIIKKIFKINMFHKIRKKFKIFSTNKSVVKNRYLKIVRKILQINKKVIHNE
jgi:hypothetical protein